MVASRTARVRVARIRADVEQRPMTPQEWASWQDLGYFVRAQQFDAQELEGLRAAAEAVARDMQRASAGGRTYWLDGKRFVDVGATTVQFEHSPPSDTVRVVEPVHDLHPLLDGLVDDARIVEPMRELVGTPEVTLWSDKLNLKRPREGTGFGWHQDAPYWVHSCGHVDKLPNVMIPLADAYAGNGCFRVIAGSHRSGCLPGTNDGSQLGGFYTDPAAFDLSRQVAFEVPAGSLIFFDPYTVHGSEPNASDAPRRALVYTYQPAGFAMLKSGVVRRPAGPE